VQRLPGIANTQQVILSFEPCLPLFAQARSTRQRLFRRIPVHDFEHPRQIAAGSGL